MGTPYKWTYKDRTQLEHLLKQGMTQREVCDYFDLSGPTVAREIQRGLPEGRKNRSVLYSKVLAMETAMKELVGDEGFNEVIKNNMELHTNDY